MNHRIAFAAVATLVFGLAAGFTSSPASADVCLRINKGNIQAREPSDSGRCPKRWTLVPNGGERIIPVNLELVGATGETEGDTNITRHDLIDRPGAIVRLSCRTEDAGDTRAAVGLEATDAPVLFHARYRIRNQVAERGGEFLDPEQVTNLTVGGHQNELDVGFLQADLLSDTLARNSAFIRLRILVSVLFAPEGRCFFQGTAHVIVVGEPEMIDFTD